MKKDILSLTLDELCSEMELLGEKKFRGKQIYEWLHIKRIHKFDNMSSDEIDKLDELKTKYINSSKIEEKVILIIKIYELLHYQMMFPFCTYSLIVEGKI